MEAMARRGSSFLGAAARTAERNALVLGFALALAVGLLAPAPGQQVAGAKWTATMLVVCIFVVSGLTLKTAEAKAALRAVWPTLYSIVSILALSPVLGMLVLRSGQAARGNIIPWGFWVGIAIFSAVPTTLSSGVTLVQNAGGSGALALLLVVVTNMLGVFTTPLWIQAYAKAGLLSTTSAGSSAPPNLDAASLLSKLALTILVPIVVAKLAREALAYFCQFDVGRFKRWLGHLSSLALVTIVWTNISLSADKLRAQSAESIGMLIALGVLFHLTLLALNALVVLTTMREVAPATALEDGEESATSEIQMESLNGHDNHHTLEMQKTGGGGAYDGADDDEITPEPAAPPSSAGADSIAPPPRLHPRWWMPSPEGIASLVLSSQKTLPVVLTVLALVPEDALDGGEDGPASNETKGLAAVACVVAHICQLFIDGALAGWWSGQTRQ